MRDVYLFLFMIKYIILFVFVSCLYANYTRFDFLVLLYCYTEAAVVEQIAHWIFMS